MTPDLLYSSASGFPICDLHLSLTQKSTDLDVAKPNTFVSPPWFIPKDPGVRQQRREVRKWRQWHEVFCILNAMEQHLNEVEELRCFWVKILGESLGITKFILGFRTSGKTLPHEPFFQFNIWRHGTGGWIASSCFQSWQLRPSAVPASAPEPRQQSLRRPLSVAGRPVRCRVRSTESDTEASAAGRAAQSHTSGTQ